MKSLFLYVLGKTAEDGDLGMIKELNPNIMPSDSGTQEVLYNVANYLLSFIGGIAVISIIIGGIMWAMAAGDEFKIDKAKTTIKFSVIGLVVALASYVIINSLIEIFASN